MTFIIGLLVGILVASALGLAWWVSVVAPYIKALRKGESAALDCADDALAVAREAVDVLKKEGL